MAMNRRLLVDGGLVDNEPVGVMRERNKARASIGVRPPQVPIGAQQTRRVAIYSSRSRRHWPPREILVRSRAGPNWPGSQTGLGHGEFQAVRGPGLIRIGGAFLSSTPRSEALYFLAVID